MGITYSISDLAKEFDLTTRAMRFYEDMGLLRPERAGPAGRSRIYSSGDRARLKLTLRAKRLGLSLVEAKEIIDMYDSPRDTGPQLKKFLSILSTHRAQLEAQMIDLQANLEEVRVHEREARALLAKGERSLKTPAAPLARSKVASAISVGKPAGVAAPGTPASVMAVRKPARAAATRKPRAASPAARTAAGA